MAEIQITPSGFTPAATEQQTQPNPGAVGGGVATENQRPDLVVQTIEDVIDLNADEGGNNNAAGGNAERDAVEQTATNSLDVTVRLDYDVEERQLYVEFVDPRTETTLASVPRREAFSVDTDTIQDRLDNGVEQETRPETLAENRQAGVPPLPVNDAAEIPVAEQTLGQQVGEADIAPPPPPPQAQVNDGTAVVDNNPPVEFTPAPQPAPEEAAGGTRAEILDEALLPQAELPVQTATQDQLAIVENI